MHGGYKPTNIAVPFQRLVNITPGWVMGFPCPYPNQEMMQSVAAMWRSKLGVLVILVGAGNRLGYDRSEFMLGRYPCYQETT